SASKGFCATHCCASASENGPSCSPSIETYHSSSSAGGGFAIAEANAALSAFTGSCRRGSTDDRLAAPAWRPGSAAAAGGSTDRSLRAGLEARAASISVSAGGAPVVDFFGLVATSAGAPSGSGTMPSRTVMTFAQFLQRILRILPRTRSSPIEYRVLQRSHRNFTLCPVSSGSARHKRGGSGLRSVTRGSILPKKTGGGKGLGPTSQPLSA